MVLRIASVHGFLDRVGLAGMVRKGALCNSFYSYIEL